MDQLMHSFIEASARRAGQTLLQYFRSPNLQIEAKGIGDLVTEADRASEEILIAAIRDRFPDHSIVAEESGRHTGDPKYVWLIDPLEATFNFSRGLPMWGINLALTVHDEVMFGAFFDPLLDELYYAERAAGAFLNGQPIRTSRLEDETKAAVYCSTRANVDRLSGEVQKFRHIGSIGNALAYVAAGYLDGAVEVGGGPWDYAVGKLLVEGAGGCLAAIGTPEMVLAAATPALHARLRLLLDP